MTNVIAQPQKIEQVVPVIMCRDVTASIVFYTQCLGFILSFQDAPTDPKYAGVKRDSVELHLQWMDASQFKYPIDQPNYRFVVKDVDALYREFSGKNFQMGAVADTPWGTREFHVKDPNGNGLQFYKRTS